MSWMLFVDRRTMATRRIKLTHVMVEANLQYIANLLYNALHIEIR